MDLYKFEVYNIIHALSNVIVLHLLFSLNYFWSLLVDINECNSGLHNCHAYATCHNTFGGFGCTCNLGITGNGTFCQGELEEGLPGVRKFQYSSYKRVISPCYESRNIL